MPVSQEKENLRRSALAERDRLDSVQRIEMSLAAAEIARGQIGAASGSVVSGFFPIRSEIDPRPLLDFLRQGGARLCLPVVVDKETIVFRELLREGELIDTGFGTRGPSPKAAELDPDIVVMPLAAFDRRGGRIGYGAGYYDRAIAKLRAKGKKPQLIGFAFSCQEAEAVPLEPHDVSLEAVVTEREFISCLAKV